MRGVGEGEKTYEIYETIFEYALAVFTVTRPYIFVSGPGRSPSTLDLMQISCHRRQIPQNSCKPRQWCLLRSASRASAAGNVRHL